MATTPAPAASNHRRVAAALVVSTVLLVAGCSSSSKTADAGAAAKKKAYDSAVTYAEKAKRDASSGDDTTATAATGSTSASSTTALKGDGTTAASTTAPAARTTLPPRATVPPQQVAAQAKVVPADLPAGWSGTPARGLYAAILPCLSGAAGASRPTAQADGDRFSIGAPDSSVQALTTTAVFPSAAVAKSVVDAASTPQFGRCVTSVVAQAAQVQGPTGGPLAPVQGLPARGDQSSWLRGALGAADPAGGGTPLPVDALISPIRTGSTVSFLVLVATGSHVDQWMITDLSQAVADRQH